MKNLFCVSIVSSFCCRYNADTDRLELSYSRFKKSDLSVLGHMVLVIFRAVRLIDVTEGIGEDGEYTECSNMTIINLALRVIGPTHERRLTIYLLTFQVISCRHLPHKSYTDVPSPLPLLSYFTFLRFYLTSRF